MTPRGGRPPRVAVDALGGDLGPRVVVEGAVEVPVLQIVMVASVPRVLGHCPWSNPRQSTDGQYTRCHCQKEVPHRYPLWYVAFPFPVFGGKPTTHLRSTALHPRNAPERQTCVRWSEITAKRAGIKAKTPVVMLLVLLK